jgi:hypothetical protein
MFCYISVMQLGTSYSAIVSSSSLHSKLHCTERSHVLRHGCIEYILGCECYCEDSRPCFPHRGSRIFLDVIIYIYKNSSICFSVLLKLSIFCLENVQDKITVICHLVVNYDWFLFVLFVCLFVCLFFV